MEFVKIGFRLNAQNICVNFYLGKFSEIILYPILVKPETSIKNNIQEA